FHRGPQRNVGCNKAEYIAATHPVEVGTPENLRKGTRSYMASYGKAPAIRVSSNFVNGADTPLIAMLHRGLPSR
ncbi:hypothetical protein, partial [Burkholderia gladioli]